MFLTDIFDTTIGCERLPTWKKLDLSISLNKEALESTGIQFILILSSKWVFYVSEEKTVRPFGAELNELT